jgi:hypothetical protein
MVQAQVRLLRRVHLFIVSLKKIIGMRKIIISVMVVLAMTSCSNASVDEMIEGAQERQELVVVTDDYRTMYSFLQDLVSSELFEGLTMPENPSYDDLMHICAPIVMTDLFGDTFAEGDCEKEYRLMLAYFEENDPESEIAKYLRYIIENGMY